MITIGKIKGIDGQTYAVVQEGYNRVVCKPERVPLAIERLKKISKQEVSGEGVS